MEHYAGIDVSLEESSVCLMDATGKIVREVKVASEPEARGRADLQGAGDLRGRDGQTPASSARGQEIAVAQRMV